MASFTLNDRSYEVRITIGLLPKLRELGFDVARAAKDAAAMQALDNPETLGAILWALVGEKATAAGLTPETFANQFDGESLYAAVDAIVGAVADFTHRSAVATEIKRRLPIVNGIRERRAVAALDRLIQEMEAGVGAGATAPTAPTAPTAGSTTPSSWLGSAGNSPESSGSTPAG